MMNDLSEKIGLLMMVCLLVLLIVSSFNIGNNLNMDNSTSNSSNKSNNSTLLIKDLILNESSVYNTFNDSQRYGIYIQDIENNNVIMDLNSEKEYSSPLTKNLLLNLAILNKYGSDSKLNITTYTKGKIINGSLYGDLIIVLKGNTNILDISSLNLDSELKNLSRQIKKYGIHQINGDILIDMDNQNKTKNLAITLLPSANGKIANVKMMDNITNFDIVSNVLTVNYTTNKSIDVITNNSTIILNGTISNESKCINLKVPINNSNFKNAVMDALNNESIKVNNGINIDYGMIYEDLLIKNNLINGNITNLTVNTSDVEIKNSTLSINISFINNSSKYDDYELVTSLETKSLIDYLIPNLILFNESNDNNLIYVLDNTSNKSFENGLKSLNEFLDIANFNSNHISNNSYEKSLISPKLSSKLLIYLYNQKYFSNFYNNMVSINGSNNIKILNNSLIYQNNNTTLLNQSIIGYMDTKIVFSIYLNDVEVLNGNESEKIMNDTVILLEKVCEKYN